MARVKLGDVAREYKATVKKSDGLPVVGLEHLTPGEITLSHWDVDTENTFTKGFKKGHMLFGRRRAYLKKAAQAPFDGICSGDITVIEAIPEKINPELLPFIIQNDMLFDYAVGNSAGSLSPRVKWESLKDYEFELPELNKQEALVELLKAANCAKDAYKKQLVATDELVKSQFIEQIINDESIPKVELGEIFDISSGGTPTRSKSEYWDHGTIPWVKISDMKSMYLDVTEEKITALGVSNSSTKLYRKGTFLLSIFATLGEVSILNIDATTNQAIAGLEPKCDVDIEYTYIALTQLKETILKIGRGAAQNNINLSILRKLTIPMPDSRTRKRFSEFVKQSDKSKFELLEAISRIDKLIKSLIQQENE